ncbi:MAG: hypothetical protein PHI97_04285 [Desulfobulbus sp.]|nr:hypothetical protein [Desulfobulbus sp.]
MNHRRRLISSAAFAAVTALVFFLPHLISTSAVLPHLVSQLNTHLPGLLEVQSCSLRWSGGVSCEGVRYTDNLLALELQLPRISSDKGLFTLLLAPQYLGQITLNRPALTFLQPKNTSRQSVDDNAPHPVNPMQRLPISWWEQRSLRLKLQGGQILAAQGARKSPLIVARELNLSGDLALGTVNYVFDFLGGQAAGQFHAQGFVNLPISGQPFFPSLISQSTFDVRSMEIEPILALAASRFPNVPLGQGTLNGACRLNMAGVDNLEVKGMTSLNNLHLSGGFLGEDSPRFQQVRLTFEGSKHPKEGWRLSQLALQSAPLSFSSQGLLDRQRIDFNGQGEADLSQLASALPHLFAIHEQTSIQQGKFTFSLQADGELNRISLKADCGTERLELTQGGKPYAWDNPLSLHAVGTVRPAGVSFSALQLHGPFLTVEGQGGAEDFTLKAEADLDHLFTELDKIFALDLHATGGLYLALGSSRIDPDQLRLTTELSIDAFGVARNGQPLMPVHPFSLRGELTGKPWFQPRSGLQSLHFTASGWPGTVQVDADQIQEHPEQSSPEAENCRISTDLNLQRLEQILYTMRGQKPALQVEGRLQAETRGGWRQAQLQLRQLKGHLQDLVLGSGGSTLFREPLITLGLENDPLQTGALNLGPLQVVQGTHAVTTPAAAFCRIDLQPFVLDLQHLRLRGPEKVVDVQGLFGNRQDGQVQPVLAMHGQGGLQLLVPWWQQQGWLDTALDATGQIKVALFLHPPSAERSEAIEFSLGVKDLAIKKGKKILYTDPRIQLDVALQPGNGDAQTAKITRLAVESSPFSFSGAGLVHNRQAPPLLELQGELHPGAVLVNQLLHTLVPSGFLVKEVKPGNILMSAALHLPAEMNQVTLSGQLDLEELRALGITLPTTSAVIDMNRGTLGVQIKSATKGAQLALHPQWQQEGDQLILRLPSDMQVLDHLPITQALNEGLLRLLPPLGCLVQATGTIGVKVTRFSLPLNDKKRQADFAVVIDLHDARPQAVQALKQLLETVGLANKPLRFHERELICEGWNGSITCAPLRLTIGDQELTLSGSRRRNGTLAYKVGLPVTEQLTQKAGVAVYGTFAAVAQISGRQSAPVFDQDRFFQGLASQITASLPNPVVDDSAGPGSPQNAQPQAVQPPESN